MKEKSLSVILDEIEERRLDHVGAVEHNCSNCAIINSDVPALVKALRRANSFITWVALDPKLELEAIGARNAITAILTSREAKKELGK